jgi:hypothetical protein
MSLSLTDPTFSAKIYWTIPDPVGDDVYRSIAEQVLMDSSITTDQTDPNGYIWHLRARHILAWGNSLSGLPTIVNGQIMDWGACGRPQSIPTGIAVPGQSGGVVDTQDAKLALSAAAGVSGAAITALGGVTSAAATLGVSVAALNAIPIVGTIASLAILPFAIIFAHHAAAVAAEQGDICSCTAEINQWLDLIDQAVASGQILPDDGVSYIHQLETQYDQCLSPISASCHGDTNAACDYKATMRCMVLLRQWMYQQSAQPAAVAAPPIATQTDASGAVTFYGYETPTCNRATWKPNPAYPFKTIDNCLNWVAADAVPDPATVSPQAAPYFSAAPLETKIVGPQGVVLPSSAPLLLVAAALAFLFFRK